MSDESLHTTARMAVIRNGKDKMYYIYAYTLTDGWVPVTRGYKHSTSCYAALGRSASRKAQQGL